MRKFSLPVLLLSLSFLPILPAFASDLPDSSPKAAIYASLDLLWKVGHKALSPFRYCFGCARPAKIVYELPKPLTENLAAAMAIKYHHNLIFANGVNHATAIHIAEIDRENKILGNFPVIIERLIQMEGLARVEATCDRSLVTNKPLKARLVIALLRETAVVPDNAGELFTHNEGVAHIFDRLPDILEFLIEREDNLIAALEHERLQGALELQQAIRSEAARRKTVWTSLAWAALLYPNRAQAYMVYEVIFNHLIDLESFQIVQEVARIYKHREGQWIGRVHEDFIVVLKRLVEELHRPAREFRKALGLDLPRPKIFKLTPSKHRREIENFLTEALRKNPLPKSTRVEPVPYLAPYVLKNRAEPTKNSFEESFAPQAEIHEEKVRKVSSFKPPKVKKSVIEAIEAEPALPLNEKQREWLFSAFNHSHDQVFLRILFDMDENNLKITHQEIKDFALKLAHRLNEMGIAKEQTDEFLENVKNHPSHEAHGHSSGKLLSSHRVAIARKPFISIGAFVPRSFGWVLKRSTDFAAMDDYIVAKARKLLGE